MPCQLRDRICIRVVVLGRGVDLRELLKRSHRLLQAAEVDLGVGIESILRGRDSGRRSAG